MNNRLLTLLMLAGFLAFGALARADVIPDPLNTVSCSGRQVGYACKMDNGQSGVCQKEKCNYAYINDYRRRNPNEIIEFDCLKCVEGNGWNSGNGGGNGNATGASSITWAVSPWFLAGLFSVLFIKRRRSKPD